MPDGSDIANEGNIAHFYAEYVGREDVHLMAIAASWNNHPRGIAATKILAERQAIIDQARHAELLAEIKRPHWSVTPLFWISVVGAFSAVVAAYYAYLAYSQSQQSVVVEKTR